MEKKVKRELWVYEEYQKPGEDYPFIGLFPKAIIDFDFKIEDKNSMEKMKTVIEKQQNKFAVINIL